MARGPSFGHIKYENWEDVLKRQGFKFLKNRILTWPKHVWDDVRNPDQLLRGHLEYEPCRCKEFRKELCGVLRISCFLKNGGKGYSWRISWNYDQLKRAVNKLVQARGKPEERGLAMYNQSSEWRKWEAVRKKYDELHSYLTRHTARFSPEERLDIGLLKFVAIPGMENVTDKGQRDLLVSLQRVLSDTWVIRQSTARSGPPSGNRTLTSDEKVLIGQLTKKGATIREAADAVERSRTNTKDAKADDALYQMVRREVLRRKK